MVLSSLHTPMFKQDAHIYNNLKIPLRKTSHAQQSVVFRGSKIWNEILLDIKNKPLNSFKIHMKIMLKSKY